MKTTTYLLLFVCIGCIGSTLNAQEIDIEKRKALLVGYWSVEDKGTLVIEASGIIRIEANGEVINTGNWELNEDGTVFYILEGEKIVETMEIIEISTERFIFKPEGSKEVILKRTSAEAIKIPDELNNTVETKVTLSTEEIANRKKLLVGNWVVGDENVLDIQVDGIIQEKKKGKIDKTGTWQLSEDGNTLYILEDGEVKETFVIFDITEEKLTGEVENGMDFIFVREKPFVKIDIAERKKLLLGTWEANPVEIDEIENSTTIFQLIIKKDGTITSLKGEAFEMLGRWKLSKLGDYLTITSKEKPAQKIRILSINKERMQLMSGSQAVDFIRAK